MQGVMYRDKAHGRQSKCTYLIAKTWFFDFVGVVGVRSASIRHPLPSPKEPSQVRRSDHVPPDKPPHYK